MQLGQHDRATKHNVANPPPKPGETEGKKPKQTKINPRREAKSLSHRDTQDAVRCSYSEMAALEEDQMNVEYVAMLSTSKNQQEEHLQGFGVLSLPNPKVWGLLQDHTLAVKTDLTLFPTVAHQNRTLSAKSVVSGLSHEQTVLFPFVTFTLGDAASRLVSA